MAMEHRIMTKVKVKQLTDNAGAITTIGQCQRWWNRFKVFCESTLKHR